ncbi:MAG: NUDIX domain-containing protein [Candidatus Saccharibacteria bacterium]
MRQAVRALVVRDGYLLVMYRNKFGQEYYTLPGGSVNPNEAPMHALLRQINEETSLTIVNPRLVITDDAGDPFGMQYVYLCQYVGGEPKLSPTSEEAKITALGQNLYSPQWLPLHSLPSVPFRSEALKQAMMQGLSRGFSTTAIAINSKQEV